jgi:hypothetical protein
VALKAAASAPPGASANYVFSKTIKKSEDKNVVIVSEDAAKFIRKLKKQKGKDICVMGGGEWTRLGVLGGQSVQEWLCAGAIPGEALIEQRTGRSFETDFVSDRVWQTLESQGVLSKDPGVFPENGFDVRKTLIDLVKAPPEFDHLAIPFAHLRDERRLILN